MVTDETTVMPVCDILDIVAIRVMLNHHSNV